MIADQKAAINLWRKKLILRRQISVRSKRTLALPATTGMQRCNAAAQIVKPNVFKSCLPHHCRKRFLIRKL
jgi:hypothetical protein